MRNKWKIAFWICLLLLAVTTVIGVYSVIGQAMTLTYMKEGYSDTESDLETLIHLVRETDLTKQEIEMVLNDYKLYEYMEFKTDTVQLERITLIFENDSLNKIEKQW